MQAKDSLRPAASVRETLFASDMGVSPLDETASARQLKFSALRRMETSQPRPVMAGLTETEARRGMKLTYHWDRRRDLFIGTIWKEEEQDDERFKRLTAIINWT